LAALALVTSTAPVSITSGLCLYLDQGTSNRAGRGDDANGLAPNLTAIAAAFRGNPREHKEFKPPSTLYPSARRIVNARAPASFARSTLSLSVPIRMVP